MLTKQDIEELKIMWYSFEEIVSIKQWLLDIENKNTIPFENLISNFALDNKKEVCIK